jgi:hypothetical protein
MEMLFYFRTKAERKLVYMFGTPFGHILLSVESVSKGFQVLT